MFRYLRMVRICQIKMIFRHSVGNRSVRQEFPHSVHIQILESFFQRVAAKSTYARFRIGSVGGNQIMHPPMMDAVEHPIGTVPFHSQIDETMPDPVSELRVASIKGKGSQCALECVDRGTGLALK